LFSKQSFVLRYVVIWSVGSSVICTGVDGH